MHLLLFHKVDAPKGDCLLSNSLELTVTPMYGWGVNTIHTLTTDQCVRVSATLARAMEKLEDEVHLWNNQHLGIGPRSLIHSRTVSSQDRASTTAPQSRLLILGWEPDLSGSVISSKTNRNEIAKSFRIAPPPVFRCKLRASTSSGHLNR